MVQLGLERNGFAVWLARDGREAIDLYRQHAEEIAVVLLDVRMPGLDGLQTLEVLRQRNPEVLACFMSGDTGPCKPEELLQRGAAHVIAKPFQLDDLANILRLMTQGMIRRSSPVQQGMPGMNRTRTRTTEVPMPTVLVIDDDADTSRCPVPRERG